MAENFFIKNICRYQKFVVLLQQILADTYMKNLSQIFPCDYLNPPTVEDLYFEVQEMLCYSDTPLQVLDKIQSLDCPYYKEALLLCYMDTWLQMVKKEDPITYYEDGDGNKIANWPDAVYDMKRLIKRYRNEQDSFVYTATDLRPTHQRSITQHVKDSVKQVVNDLLAIKEIAQSQTIIIQNLHIHNHYYYSTVGQVTDTINEQINNQL